MRVPSLLATATLVFGVGIAGPAQGEDLRRQDPLGDVVREGPAKGTSAFKSLDNTDVRRFIVKHRRSRVVTLVKYESMSASGFEEIYLRQRIRTSHNTEFLVSVDVGQTLHSATLRIADADTFETVACPDGRASVDRHARRVRWVVPRACLDSPAWFRTLGSSGSVTEDEVRFADDFLTAKAPNERWSRRLHAD
jgi:hypothetical protein